MSIRATPFIEGEYYHIYNRGNSKQIIFHDNDDMQRFQDLLFIVNKTERVDMREIVRDEKISKTFIHEGKTFANKTFEKEHDIAFNTHDAPTQHLSTGEGLAFASTISPNASEFSKLVSIGSYCIMSNHFHILLTPLVEGGVSKFMQKLSTAYPMYYNKKYAHTGGIFEGKFKAKHIHEDRYLKYLFAYINLNPVKLIDQTWKQYGLKDIQKTFLFLDTYKYSSYSDLLYREGKTFANKNKTVKRSEADILSLEYFPEYFPSGADFKKEIIVWFSYRNDF